jgi:hypothetical protein
MPWSAKHLRISLKMGMIRFLFIINFNRVSLSQKSILILIRLMWISMTMEEMVLFRFFSIEQKLISSILISNLVMRLMQFIFWKLKCTEDQSLKILQDFCKLKMKETTLILQDIQRQKKFSEQIVPRLENPHLVRFLSIVLPNRSEKKVRS